MSRILNAALALLRLPRNAESALQHGIVQSLEWRNILVFHVPNETNISNAVTRMILQLIGLRKGVSDLIIIVQGHIYFVEIKTPKGKQTEAQKKFQERVEALGFTYWIWRSVDDSENFCKELKEK